MEAAGRIPDSTRKGLKMEFWNLLREAFSRPEGFTVICHLDNGMSINMSMKEPRWNLFMIFEGTNIETQNQVAIGANHVIAYEIEE